MSSTGIQMTPELLAYVRRVGVREPDLLRRLREETAKLPQAQMQIAPEQGALLGLLVRLIGARRTLEIGTFTGYSSLSVALALPDDGRVVCCDSSREWTDVARRYWTDAGVTDKITLHLGPATETLTAMLERDDAGSTSHSTASGSRASTVDPISASTRRCRSSSSATTRPRSTGCGMP